MSAMLTEICRIVGLDLDGGSTERSLSGDYEEVLYSEALCDLIALICRRHQIATNTAFDGVKDAFVQNETESTLEFCGLFYTLVDNGDDMVPVQFRLEKQVDGLHYDVRIERADVDLAAWRVKRLWDQVSLLCHGDLQDPWEWKHHASGILVASP